MLLNTMRRRRSSRRRAELRAVRSPSATALSTERLSSSASTRVARTISARRSRLSVACGPSNAADSRELALVCARRSASSWLARTASSANWRWAWSTSSVAAASRAGALCSATSASSCSASHRRRASGTSE
eukprot:scaffold145145_cov30-Tisochrysis_lutea.AAC.1